jgi:hypothetical protein
MKSIQFKIILNDDNKIASLENATNLPQDKVESHLLIIGLLENLKQHHLRKLNILFEKKIKKSELQEKLDEDGL